MKVAEPKSEFESLYSKTVQECVSLIEQETNYEQQQIRVALEIGKRINKLVTGAAEGEAVVKRLARDVFKARGKIIASSKFLEYQQLYLNFGNVETVKTLAEKALNDLSLDSLFKMVGTTKGVGDGGRPHKSDIVSILDKALKCLDRVERILEDRQLSEEELAEIIKSMESVRDTADCLFVSIKTHCGQNQPDLFKFDSGSYGSTISLLN